MCTYDMTLKRQRWWGFYVLTPFLLLGLFLFLVLGLVRWEEQKIGVSLLCFGFGLSCFLGVLLLYAPYTFHNLLRFFGLLVFCVYVWYCADTLFLGKWSYSGRSQPSVLNAILGLMAFGIPGIIIFLKAKRTKNTPYRKNGSIRKILLRDLRQFYEDDEKQETRDIASGPNQ